jgi:outer membrane protein TolC
VNSVTSYNRTKASAGFFLINQSYGPNIGIAIGIPIYNSNIFRTQERVNKVSQETQKLQIESISTQVTRDLVNAFNEYDNASQTADIERRNTLLAKENNFISTERFRKLQSNSIELRTAQLSLIDTQDKLINALFRAKLAEISIRLLAGELAAQPVN